MSELTLGSLFDGIAGFPLAGTRVGIRPVWASEIVPFCVNVTSARFPELKHLGDVTKINGAEVEPVDIITFGSPCQDMSQAGRRAGMKHEDNGDDETTRSGLFMEAVRIIRQMREATKDGLGTIYPRWAVWENVPGAFSSQCGEDFYAVIESLARIAEPDVTIPFPDKVWDKRLERWKYVWKHAGAVVGSGWSIAWRTLDAQHWGVPQRRRRIFLVCDFGGQSAPKVLFEREGLRRHLAQSGTTREEAAGIAPDGIGGTGESVELSLYENHAQDSRVTGPLDTAPTVYAKYGTGGGNTPLVVHYRKSRRAQSVNDHETWVEDPVTNTLNTFDRGDVRATDVVVAFQPEQTRNEIGGGGAFGCFR